MSEDATNLRLLAWLAACNKDPIAFVLGAFPWGTGSIAKFEGPNEWQLWVLTQVRDGLLDINKAIQIAAASGHGVGKSALSSWLILWAFTTAPDTRGVITANTENQLKTKTWAELGKWFNLFIGRDHFLLTATALLSKDPTRERTWRIDAVPWSEKNTEAFAGLHNQGKRLLLVMDEASAIPDKIHEVAEGALTDADTEIIWIMFGNPTRSTGRFREAFPGGRFAKIWKTISVDSRTIPFTNKARIESWIEAYGEDSDFVRIRVKGEFPRQGLMEFFSAVDVKAARKREVHVSISDPLALGVDVARFGSNNSVLFPRKGRDARSMPRVSHNGMDTVALANEILEFARVHRPDGIMIDGGGVGGGVVDNCRARQLFVHEIQFGGKDDVGGAAWGITGEKYANKRAAIYGAARAWLRTGAIPDDDEFETALLAIRYTYNKNDQILLVPKEDLLEDNPGIILDDVDAFCLTFGQPLVAHAGAGGDHPAEPAVTFEYDPFSEQRMSA